eukprot:7702087-Prorocentrum_lima.AAC.1
MPWVRLVEETIRRPPNDAVQQLHLLQVGGTAAQATFNLAQELVTHERLHCVKVDIVACEGEVIPMDYATNVP